MKIKHFSGYGHVNARKIAKDAENGRTTLVVEVTGNHERGIVVRDDFGLAKRWLADKFDKDVVSLSSFKVYYSVLDDYTPQDEEERAIYTFTYPSKEGA